MKTIEYYGNILVNIDKVIELIDEFYNKILKGGFTPEQLLFIAHLIEKELKSKINGENKK